MPISPSTRPLAILDAPSNLGLRPPVTGSVPGCYKLPWALRDRHVMALLGATDAGCVVPPRYSSRWRPDSGDRNATAIGEYSLRLADRLEGLLESERQVLVLGGDCSIALGNMLALRRRGRYGQVFIDAHGDFRHPGNSASIGAAAGEDLAILTGRGDPRLTNLQGLKPYVLEQDICVVGIRQNDDDLAELLSLSIQVTTSQDFAAEGLERVVANTLDRVTRQTQGFWIHLDLDVVDASEMPAVDSPEPEGLSFSSLTRLIKALFVAPECVGMELTIYDPDLDPEESCAQRIVDCLCQALSGHLG